MKNKLILDFLYIRIYRSIIFSLLIYVYELYMLYDSSQNSYFFVFFVFFELLVDIRTGVDVFIADK